MSQLKDLYSLQGQTVIITGGAGLLGKKHAETVCEMGGTAILFDLWEEGLAQATNALQSQYPKQCFGIKTDITDPSSIEKSVKQVLVEHSRIDVLINNAANNPKVENNNALGGMRAENYPLKTWNEDIAVGLTGAFLCIQKIGPVMAESKKGVILNILSDLALIAPDQRLYRNPELPEATQPVKPPSYSAVKTGLLGLTRYFATYWAHQGVRVNALSPGGVENGQPEDFTRRISELIPLQRMAKTDELKGAVAFLISDASSYMNGANLVIDGGRTVW